MLDLCRAEVAQGTAATAHLAREATAEAAELGLITKVAEIFSPRMNLVEAVLAMGAPGKEMQVVVILAVQDTREAGMDRMAMGPEMERIKVASVPLVDLQFPGRGHSPGLRFWTASALTLRGLPRRKSWILWLPGTRK